MNLRNGSIIYGNPPERVKDKYKEVVIVPLIDYENNLLAVAQMESNLSHLEGLVAKLREIVKRMEKS